MIFIRCISIIVFISIIVIGNGLFYGYGSVIPFIGEFPSLNNEYFAYSGDIGDTEHTYIYFDIGDVNNKIQHSDILMFGNSRMQMAWDTKLARSVASHNHVTIYNVSCGMGEGFEFYYELIKKYPISNKVVLIAVDKLFENISVHAKDNLHADRASLLFDTLIKQTNFRIKNISEKIFLPQLLEFFGHVRVRYLIFRNMDDGYWNTEYFTEMNKEDQHCKYVYNRLVTTYNTSSLKKFIHELRNNNCLVILVSIPSTDSSPQDVKEIARIENLHFLESDEKVESLTTCDGSHLNRHSATKFTNDVFPRMINMYKWFLSQGYTFK